MTLRLRNVQIDVSSDRHDEAVAFWAAALDATPRSGRSAFTTLLDARAPLGVLVQRLEDGPPRFHLDLEADDVDAEIDRLCVLGAEVVRRGEEGGVLTDPAGLPFCVAAAGRDLGGLRPEVTQRARLRVIVIDVSSALTGTVTEFWAAALGASAERLQAPNEAFTHLADVQSPSAGPIAILVQDTGPHGPTRTHLDLHVPDPAARDAEVARLRQLGAEPVAEHRHWAVLEAPSGHLFCVVPDRADVPN